MIRKIISIFIVSLSMIPMFSLEAKVVSIKGKVEIQEAGMWVPVEKGDIIEKGTVISTGFNSELVVDVKNSTFTLGPLTRVTIENLVTKGNKDTTQIYIDSGSIAANVSNKGGRRTGFKVRSPVATASVRGTAFIVSSSGKLTVTEGLVAFGPAESSSSEVDTESADEDVVSDEAVADSGDDSQSGEQHADAFASTEDVGGEGVPVAAGQTSTASVSGFMPSSPRTEMAKASVGGVDSTVTVSALNAVGSGRDASSISSEVTSKATAVTSPVVSDLGDISVAVKSTGSLSVTAKFEN